MKARGSGARKHGGSKRRVWCKIHIGIDGKTLEIRAAEVTTSDVGDAPMLPELLDQIPPEQEITTVTALLQNGGVRRDGPFPLRLQATRTISVVPRALKLFMRAMRMWISAVWRSGVGHWSAIGPSDSGGWG